MSRAVHVAVTPSVLEWALARSGRAQSILRTHSCVNDWLEETKQPTLAMLKEFARWTHVPFGYLFLSEPPEERLPIPFYRTDLDRHGTPSPNLLEMVQTLERRQIWMHQYRISLGEAPLKFVQSVRLGDDPCQVAKVMRQTLGLNPVWAARQPSWERALTHLRDKIDKAGAVVSASSIVGLNTHRKLDPAEFRGFVLVDRYAPFLFINGADYRSAQMFTLAHELAHVWVGRSAAFDLRELRPADNQLERYCNSIAAEFLVPEEELRNAWADYQDADVFQAAAWRFKVSELVVARKALDSGLISKDAFLTFYEDYVERLKGRANSKSRGGDFYTNQTARLGHGFAVSVIQAAKAGSILYKDAYRLTGISGSTFEKYAVRLGLGEES